MAIYTPGAEPGMTAPPITNFGTPTTKYYAALYIIVPIAVIVGIVALWRYNSTYGKIATGIVVLIVAWFLWQLSKFKL